MAAFDWVSSSRIGSKIPTQTPVRRLDVQHDMLKDTFEGALLNARIWYEHATQDSLDPREEASRYLILLHGLERQTENAVRVFQDCEITLHKVLDIEPTSETRHALGICARSGDVVACRKSLMLPTQVPVISLNSSVPLIRHA